MFNKIIERYKAVAREEGGILKVLIGGLMLYIPVLGWAVSFGFIMDLLEDVKEKREVKLPKWQNFEKLFMDGLPLALFLTVLIIVLMVISLILNLIPCMGQIINLIVNVGFSIIMPALIIIAAYRLRATTKWQDALAPGAIIEELQKDFKAYFPVLLGLCICMILSVILGCCGVLAPFTGFYTAVALYPLVAEVYVAGHSDKTGDAPAGGK